MSEPRHDREQLVTKFREYQATVMEHSALLGESRAQAFERSITRAIAEAERLQLDEALRHFALARFALREAMS